MSENKKINKIIFTGSMVIFLSYVVIYTMVNLGYYEYSNYKNKVYTEEQIKKFEEDIKNGVDLSLTSYIEEEKVKIKKQVSLKISEFIGDISRESIKKIFKILNKIVET